MLVSSSAQQQQAAQRTSVSASRKGCAQRMVKGSATVTHFMVLEASTRFTFVLVFMEVLLMRSEANHPNINTGLIITLDATPLFA
jgi:hypothetical protein